jgi:hypothetical protein
MKTKFVLTLLNYEVLVIWEHETNETRYTVKPKVGVYQDLDLAEWGITAIKMCPPSNMREAHFKDAESMMNFQLKYL